MLEPTSNSANPLPLRITDLNVSLRQGRRDIPVVNSVTLQVSERQIVGLVGESGSGKSVSCLAAMGLLGPGWHTDGGIEVNGRDLQSVSKSEVAEIRGRDAAMIFQDAAASLNPIAKIGSQLSETVGRLRRVGAKEAREVSLDLLAHVGIPEPRRRYDEYPFQLSGGQNQRVMIALALAGNPRILFADEPTTALDVTVQAQILDLISRLKDETGMGVVFVSHDLGVVANLCHDVAVMYAGRIVEQGPVQAILNSAVHPYTRGLIKSMPTKHGGKLYSIGGRVPFPGERPPGCAFAPRCPRRIDRCGTAIPELRETPSSETAAACFNPTGTEGPAPAQSVTEAAAPRPEQSVLLQLSQACCDYSIRIKGKLFSRPGIFRAVRNADLELRERGSLALIGESGSGKSTISKLALGTEAPSAGKVLFDGLPVPRIGSPEHKAFTRDVQLVPQSPYLALDPRVRAGRQIAEPLEIHGIGTATERQHRVNELFEAVALPAELADRFPHELSGGQLQRIVIARALALGPRLLICDEPTSALDVSVQAQIVELLKDLRTTYGLTILFITHDLRIIRSLCDRVAVMFAGEIVEYAETDALFERPAHPYTRDLLAAAPDLDERIAKPVEGLQTDIPTSGCRYRLRCSRAEGLCAERDPPAIALGRQAYASCHFASRDGR